MSFLSYQHFPIYSVMALFLGAFLIVLFGRSKFLRNLIAFLATAIALGCMIMLIKPVMLEHEIICYWMGNRAMAGGYAMGIAMEVDQVSLFFGLLISTAVFVACVYSLQYMEHDDNKPQYYTLFLMLAGGVMGLVLSGDLFNMFIMVEILTFAAVALTAFRNKAFGALEAAFKYLVVGCMGSTCILAGTIMLYAQAHTLNFAQLSSIISGDINPTTLVAFALLYIGFSTKAFIVPFHPLAADAHGAAPASISVLISGVLTKSGVYAILRLTYFLFQTMQLGSIQFMLVFVGSVSMFVCVTMAPLDLPDRLCAHRDRPRHRPRPLRRPLPRDEPHDVQGPALPCGRRGPLPHRHHGSAQARRPGQEDALDLRPVPHRRGLHQRHPALQRLRLQVDDLPGDLPEGGREREHRLPARNDRGAHHLGAHARLLRQGHAVRLLRSLPRSASSPASSRSWSPTSSPARPRTPRSTPRTTSAPCSTALPSTRATRSLPARACGHPSTGCSCS